MRTRGTTFGGVLLQHVRKLTVIVVDQMSHVNVTVILLEQYILPNLVSVDKDVIEGELHDEVDKRLLNAGGCS